MEKIKKLKKGDWLFTCSMEPLQFNSFDEEKNPDDYNRAGFTDEDWEQFSKYNDFTTINGSSHAVQGCGCKPVSEKYALWFIENKCWELYEKSEGNNEIENDKKWKKYEEAIKALCIKEGIEYEGH